MTDCRLLLRPRLLELAAQRWNRRAVAVVAGPGFGKSVLLAQASAENRLAPRGVELVVTCTESDASPVSLLGRLADALDHIDGMVGPAPIGPEPVLKELARRWPLGVCVVLDDVHHALGSLDGMRLLARLVNEAPTPVHFLLAGRCAVPGLGALRARGEILDVGEDELAFLASEIEELAELYGVDPSRVATSGGWPAVASVTAACGIDLAGDYVWDTVVEHVDDRQRRILAVAAAIGSCDPALLHTALGGEHSAADDFDVLARLPLVARRDGELIVHDLWRQALSDTLTTDERRAVVSRAAGALVERHDYDRAHQLCTDHDLWDDAAAVLRACCRRGYPDVRSHVLVRWLATLPPHRQDEPDGLLLRGLVGRMLDLFDPATADLLERAAACHRAIGDVTGEIAAINELAYVLRNQGRGADLPALVVRAAEIQAAGHHGADGLLAMARSMCAELAGDVRGMVDELDSAPIGSLSRDWQAIVAFRRTIGYLTTGDERLMLEAAGRCVDLAGDSTLRHVQAMADWFAGDPQPAIDALDAIIADAHRSLADAVALGAFATMVLATTGRLDEAHARLAHTEEAASGGSVVPMMRGYLIGVRALVAAADGDDAAARQILETALADAPLTDPVGWLTATRWLPLAYVLVPAARPVIDEAAGGPLHTRRLAIARAVVAARALEPIDERMLEGMTPASIATTVPLPWAMVLAARLHADGAPLGRDLASSLMERSGVPARDALRMASEHTDRVVAAGARKLLAAIPLTPESIRLDVLGPTALGVGAAGTGPDWQRERVRSLLLYLVLHGPARREAITEALWPGLDASCADRNLRVTLAYLQRVLEPDRRKGEAPFFVRTDGQNVVVAGAPHVVVDAHEFEYLVDRAEDADRRGAPSLARQLFETAVRMWRGPCLADVAYEEWAQHTCRVLTERFVGAAVRAGELSLAAGDTTAARRHARRALSADDWSEPAHRVMIAAALCDGDRAGAARAVATCNDMLADLGVVPGPETMMLVRQIRTPAIAVA